jgi:hypothetical protein
MVEMPLAALLSAAAVRRQFDPTAPPEPEPPRRARRAVRQARLAASAALLRAARAVEPRPECTPAH